MAKFLTLSGLILSLCITACSKNDSSPTSGHNNSPPSIVNVTATPSHVTGDGESQLTCIAVDPDGEHLSYYWSCATAKFDVRYSGGEEYYQFKATDNPTQMDHFDPGVNVVYITISDGIATDLNSIRIVRE